MTQFLTFFSPFTVMNAGMDYILTANDGPRWEKPGKQLIRDFKNSARLISTICSAIPVSSSPNILGKVIVITQAAINTTDKTVSFVTRIQARNNGNLYVIEEVCSLVSVCGRNLASCASCWPQSGNPVKLAGEILHAGAPLVPKIPIIYKKLTRLFNSPRNVGASREVIDPAFQRYNQMLRFSIGRINEPNAQYEVRIVEHLSREFAGEEISHLQEIPMVLENDPFFIHICPITKKHVRFPMMLAGSDKVFEKEALQKQLQEHPEDVIPGTKILGKDAQPILAVDLQKMMDNRLLILGKKVTQRQAENRLINHIPPSKLLDLTEIPPELYDDPVLSQYICPLSKRPIRTPVICRGKRYELRNVMRITRYHEAESSNQSHLSIKDLQSLHFLGCNRSEIKPDKQVQEIIENRLEEIGEKLSRLTGSRFEQRRGAKGRVVFLVARKIFVESGMNFLTKFEEKSLRLIQNNYPQPRYSYSPYNSPTKADEFFSKVGRVVARGLGKFGLGSAWMAKTWLWGINHLFSALSFKEPKNDLKAFYDLHFRGNVHVDPDGKRSGLDLDEIDWNEFSQFLKEDLFK